MIGVITGERPWGDLYAHHTLCGIRHPQEDNQIVTAAR